MFLLLFTLFVAFATFSVVWFVFWANQRVTRAQIARLEHGMTEEEITAILDASPNHVVDGRNIIGVGSAPLGLPNWSEMNEVKVWQGRETVTIGFDADGRSRRIESRHVTDPSSTWDRMKRLVVIW